MNRLLTCQSYIYALISFADIHICVFFTDQIYVDPTDSDMNSSVPIMDAYHAALNEVLNRHTSDSLPGETSGSARFDGESRVTLAQRRVNLSRRISEIDNLIGFVFHSRTYVIGRVRLIPPAMLFFIFSKPGRAEY